MSMKYLGETFDIHGGGLENSFPHHEDEIAQAEAATGKPFAKYWLHNNMVTVGGQKMGKSLGNFITLKDAFKKWDPMVLRLFILQSHYRSPLDFSDEALGAAKEGYERLDRSYASIIKEAHGSREGEPEKAAVDLLERVRKQFYEAMDDDFNSPLAVASLFELARETNSLATHGSLTVGTVAAIAGAFANLSVSTLGLHLREGTRLHLATPFEAFEGIQLSELPKNSRLQMEALQDTSDARSLAQYDKTPQLADFLKDLRNDARKAKNFAQADVIRKRLDEIGILLEDTPQGTKWRFK